VDGQLILNKPDYLGQQEIKRLVDSLSDVAWKNLYYHDPDVVKTEDLFWVADLARHKMGGLDVSPLTTCNCSPSR
jgi:hypothetical protein